MIQNQKNSKKILVVDDSDVIRYSIRELLQDTGIKVITCIDGMEGIKKAAEEHPDLILLDIMMPNLDGLKMLQVIKLLDDLKKIPVLVISANTNKSNVLTAMEAGAENVISKPVSKNQLFEEMVNILGKDYFSGRTTQALTVHQETEMKSEMKKLFLNSFPAKKYGIIESLNQRNKGVLKQVIHEIKGTGSAIGLPLLTSLSAEIEKDLSTFPINWNVVKAKCERIFEIIKTVEKQNSFIG
ncbi:MAG: hypothetical protein SCALA702_27130 [Melioribacteraceae bacterium]|nr:MAG: hypothetical protein SCALA702_27130 [Melioribacteraceae bacterium]